MYLLILHGRGRRMERFVTDFTEASRFYRNWIENNDLGASELRGNSGDIHHLGKKVAQVSYNGKLWDLNGEEIK